MEKSKVLIAALCGAVFMSVSAITSTAQPPQTDRPAERSAMNAERPPEMTAEEMAKRKTDLLKRELNLSDKQYKKVYKLYKKQASKELSSSKSQQRGNDSGMPGGGRMGPGGRGPGGGMGSGGGMPGGGMRGGMGMSGGGGRPPAGGMPGGDDDAMRGGRPAGAPGTGMGEPYMESDKDIASREKKMRKLLSAEQYAEWSEWDRNERRMRARRMWQQEMEQSGERDAQRTPERMRN